MKLTNQKWIKDQNILSIITAIEHFHGNIRFVGGCVRDSILSKDIKDIDLATDLEPVSVIKALKYFNIKVIPTGLKHGTVTATINNSSYEITTLRADLLCDGRHATVKFTTDWKIDASRRDFTFNALYCSKEGDIYDYFTGIEDLKLRRLKFIGSAEERIKEDYLRILRVFRFYAAICQEQLSEEIIFMCKKYADKIQLLSGERVREEFLKILSYKNSLQSLIIMQKCNVLQQIIPLKVSFDNLNVLQDVDSLVKLALIIRTNKNNKKELCNKICNNLKLSNKQTKTLKTLVQTDLILPISIIDQKKYIILFGHELYCNIIKIQFAELGVSNNELKNYLEFANTFPIPTFPISGNDLINIGYVSGKELGVKIKLIKDYWESHSYSLTKEQLLTYAHNILTKQQKSSDNS